MPFDLYFYLCTEKQCHSLWEHLLYMDEQPIRTISRIEKKKLNCSSATAVLKISHSVWDDFAASVRKYLGRLLPFVTFSDMTQTCELSFGLDFKDNKMTFDEILDLPQAISRDSGKKMVVCIDEFQNINELTTLWHFSGSYARTGRNIRTYAIACTAAKDICYWIFFIITTCLSINSGTSYFWKRYPKRIGSNLSEESFLKPERKFQENYAA